MKTLITIFAAIMLTFSGGMSAREKERGEFKGVGHKQRHTINVYRGKGLAPFMTVSFPGAHYKVNMVHHYRTPYWAAKELKARYVYFPKMDMFYDSYTDAFIYTDEVAWITSAYMAQQFSLLRLKRAEQIQVNAIPPEPKAFLEFYGTRKKRT
ncbi:MAG: hypothetical protein ACJ76F_04770 [Bacteroidia bacterium]